MKLTSAFRAFSLVGLAVFAALAAALSLPPGLRAQSTLTWSGTNDDGTANTTWSTNGDNTNWLNTASTPHPPACFQDGDTVLFNDTSSARTVTIEDAVSPASMAVNTTGTYTFEGGGSIDSPGTLTLNSSGAGHIILKNTGANNFAAVNILAGSKVTAAANNALGSAGTNLAIANNATLTLDAPAPLLGNVTMTGASTLAFAAPASGTHALAKATVTTLAAPAGSAPALVLHTNIGNGTSNTLNVTGTLTGTYTVILHNTGTGRAAQGATTLHLITTNTANNATATYTGRGTLTSGIYSYDYDFGANGTTTDWGLDLVIINNYRLNDPANAIVAAASSLPLAWFSEIDTLVAKRFRELRDTPRAEARGMSLWLQGRADRVNVNARDARVAFNETQYTTNVGFDYGKPNASRMIVLGAFAGYGGATHKNDGINGDGGKTSMSAGAYLTYINNSGFYMNLVGKYNHIRSKVAANATDSSMNARFTNHATGFSLETGLCHVLADNWQLTPSVHLASAHISSGRYATSTGIAVSQKSITTSQAKAGALLVRKQALKNGRTILPYVKLYAAHQWSRGGKVTMDNNPAVDTSPIRGARLDAGAGINWVLSKKAQVYLDYEASFARDYKQPCGLTAGVVHSW